MNEIRSVAILGASGYTGAELVRLIATHPNMKIAALRTGQACSVTIAERLAAVGAGKHEELWRH